MSAQLETLATTPEAPIAAPNAALLQNMLSDASFAQRADWIQEELRGEGNAALGHVARLMGRGDAVREDAIREYETGNPAPGTSDRAEEKRAKIMDYTERTFGTKPMGDYRNLKDAQWQLTETGLTSGNMLMWGEEADRMLGRLMQGSRVIDDGIDREHTFPPTQREGATTEDYVDYLQSKKFVPYDVLSQAWSRRALTIKLDPNKKYTIPIQNVVSAIGFQSWAGDGTNGQALRADRDRKTTDGKITSIENIKNYAERPTDLPPSEGMEGFITPDGTVIFGAGFDNHRTAAAIARGQTELSVSGKIVFHMLDPQRASVISSNL